MSAWAKHVIKIRVPMKKLTIRYSHDYSDYVEQSGAFEFLRC